MPLPAVVSNLPSITATRYQRQMSNIRGVCKEVHSPLMKQTLLHFNKKCRHISSFGVFLLHRGIAGNKVLVFIAAL